MIEVDTFIGTYSPLGNREDIADRVLTVVNNVVGPDDPVTIASRVADNGGSIWLEEHVACIDSLSEETPMRIQFELTEDRAAELKNLMKVTGSRTNKDLFDNALTLFEWAVHEIQKDPNRIIASLDEQNETYKQVEMSAFRNAASKARLAMSDDAYPNVAASG